MGVIKMVKEDRHELVQNEHIPPAYEMQSTHEVTQPMPYEENARNFKFFGCCDASLGWTIYYSMRVGRMILPFLGLTLSSLVLSLAGIQNPIPENLAVVVFSWLLPLWDMFFLVCYCLLMYGIHGKNNKNGGHGYFIPMLIFEWIEAVIMSLTGILFLVGLIFAEAYGEVYAEEVSKVGFGFFIIWLP